MNMFHKLTTDQSDQREGLSHMPFPSIQDDATIDAHQDGVQCGQVDQCISTERGHFGIFESLDHSN